MSSVFIIPDVHLKPWIFEKAKLIIEKEHFDRVVMLGDFVDDWNQEKNLDLYQETLSAALEFVKEYSDTLFCVGNHDISYIYEMFESGYSSYARDLVIEGITIITKSIPKENTAFVHRIDDVLFSHAGVTEEFVLRCFGNGPRLEIDELIENINQMKKEDIWKYDSPIWARPQYKTMRLYPSNMLQVVGHTPVQEPLREGNLLTLDTFSTYRDGTPIGDERFVWIDTSSFEYHKID